MVVYFEKSKIQLLNISSHLFNLRKQKYYSRKRLHPYSFRYIEQFQEINKAYEVN